MPDCTNLRTQYDAAIAAEDAELAAQLRQQLIDAGCPDPETPADESNLESGGGGHQLPPGG